MRCAYSAILITSVMLLTGCASGGITGSSDDRDLQPSLRMAQSRHIVQVGADFDPMTRHDTPYFVVCLGDECPAPSTKTPVKVISLKTQITSTPIASQSKPEQRAKSGQSDSYLKKKVEMLKQYRVHFDYASAELNNEGRSLLDDFVTQYPHKNASIIITGYTDNGTKPDGKIGNHWLALERALSVKKTLIDLGYPESKILLEAKFLCCYIDSNENEAGRRNNRRAEISLIHVLHQ